MTRQMADGELAELQARLAVLEEENRRLRSARPVSPDLAEVLGSITDGFVLLDEEWRFQFVNPPAERMLGRTQRDLFGKIHWDMFPESRGTVVEREYRRCLSMRVPIHFEHFYPPLHTWFDIRCYPTRHGGMAINFRDISRDKQAAAERERATQELQELTGLLDALFENAPLGLGFWDLELRFQRLNQALAQINGLPVEAHIGKTIQELLPDVADGVSQTMQRVLNTGEPVFHQPVTGTTPAEPGVPRHWSVTYYPVRRGGTVVGVGALCQETTGRVRIEEALRVSTERLQLVLDAVEVGLWYCDLPFDKLQWNARVKEHFGLTPDAEVTIHTFYERLHPDDRERTRQAIEKSIGERTDYNIEYRTVAPGNGRMRWIRAIGRGFYNAQGEAVRFDGITLDITAQKQTEDALRHSNAELEQFAYAASHDLQEPLRTIASYTQLLSRRYQGMLDQDADEFIGYVVQAVQRMRHLIHDLLVYSRVLHAQEQQMSPVDANTALSTALSQLAAAASESHATIIALPLPMVCSEESQLAQVFLNLVGNALKYRKPDTAPQITISAERKAEFWQLTVADNGIGFDPQYKDRIFALFRRLHNQTEYDGTGIGLSICKRIIERQGGSIWASSQPGQGAQFHFTLRAAEPRAIASVDA